MGQKVSATGALMWYESGSYSRWELIPATSEEFDILNYPIHGKVEDANGDGLPNANITIRNTRTNEVLAGNANATGWYSMELLELPSGYEDGDEIVVVATHGGLSTSTTITVNAEAVGSRADLKIAS